MTVSFRYDTTVITSEAADAIMGRYVGLWRTLLGAAESGRRPAESAVTLSEAP